nr:lecithin--cholesterol acyltransferase [Pleurocapsa sp. MO_192.B19]
MANNQKTLMNDLVVILPGITGSVLQKDGKDLWGASSQAIFDIVISGGKNLQQLKLKGTDSGGDYYGDDIKATRLVADAQIIPGLIKILDGYSQTSKLITDNFEVTEGDIYNDPEDKAANFYHFPYDWRRDNRINGKILNRLLSKRLKTWRETNGNSGAKVILLAHSMGGLVSRYHLEVLGGWQDCRALFTFGTPYRGSV